MPFVPLQISAKFNHHCPFGTEDFIFLPYFIPTQKVLEIWQYSIVRINVNIIFQLYKIIEANFLEVPKAIIQSVILQLSYCSFQNITYFLVNAAEYCILFPINHWFRIKPGFNNLALVSQVKTHFGLDFVDSLSLPPENINYIKISSQLCSSLILIFFSTFMKDVIIRIFHRLRCFTLSE